MNQSGHHTGVLLYHYAQYQCLVIVIVEPHEELVGGIKEVDTEQFEELTAHTSPIQTYAPDKL